MPGLGGRGRSGPLRPGVGGGRTAAVVAVIRHRVAVVRREIAAVRRGIAAVRRGIAVVRRGIAAVRRGAQLTGRMVRRTRTGPRKPPEAAQPSRIAILASMFFASSATWASATTS
ncbi:hypothetical protein SVIO_097950 [Streptomyces violaceusniger]|uniref:Uncharacterized protein n=1 Tax=Streptomyces violaceusniger TaxID=68280 RepID=A0A4D4LD20_STRVO|nr:hypothetical protein SVIO_097950 [Streptomyces violaceusniger]